jgi:DNA-binding winged helix-turn-helix (wHTH) protein
MKPTESIVFPPFRLDPANEQLWRDNQLLSLPPKAFAVLRYLTENAGRLVTKKELFAAVWPDTRVSENVLKGYIHDLREVLGDDSNVPRFIETVPRRGHRFIAPLSTSPPVASRQKLVGSQQSSVGSPQQLATGNSSGGSRGRTDATPALLRQSPRWPATDRVHYW